jgi:hypothetical protein
MKEDLQELHHEAVPGYKKIFLIVFVVFIIYLAVILINTV